MADPSVALIVTLASMNTSSSIVGMVAESLHVGMNGLHCGHLMRVPVGSVLPSTIATDPGDVGCVNGGGEEDGEDEGHAQRGG